MSIADFVRNPLAYSKGHYVQFYGGLGSAAAGGTGPDACGLQLQATYDNWSGAWKAKYFVPKPATYTEFRFVESMSKADMSWGHQVGKNNLHSVTCFPGAADLGIRFLPWEPNCVTCMEIDANARTFFTGPLQGCAIYLGQANGNGNFWAFHANRNNSGTVDNNAIKTSMTINTIPCLGTPITVRYAALYGTDYTDQGFVFGQRSGTTWTFYAANLAIAGGGFSMKINKLK